MKTKLQRTSIRNESIQPNDKWRMLSFKLPRYLEDDWANAVRRSGFTQTDILIEFVKAYIVNQTHINKDIDAAIDSLFEQKELNEKKVVAASLDDAINALKNRS